MQSDIPYLMAISDSGEIRRKQAVPSSEGENIEDLIVLTDGYGVVTSKVGDIGNTRLKLTTFDETLQYRSSISAKENYSLGYVDTLIIADKPYLLANAFGMSKICGLSAYGGMLLRLIRWIFRIPLKIFGYVTANLCTLQRPTEEAP